MQLRFTAPTEHTHHASLTVRFALWWTTTSPAIERTTRAVGPDVACLALWRRRRWRTDPRSTSPSIVGFSDAAPNLPQVPHHLF